MLLLRRTAAGTGRLRRRIISAVIIISVVIIIVISAAAADTAQQKAHQQQNDHQQRRADNGNGAGGHLSHQRQGQRHGDRVGGRLRRRIGVNDLHGGDDPLILGHPVHVNRVGLSRGAILRGAGDSHDIVALVGQAHSGFRDLQRLFVPRHTGEGGGGGFIGHIGHILRDRAGELGTETAHIQRQLLEHGVSAGLVVGVLLPGDGDGIGFFGAGGGGTGNGYGVGAHHQRIAADRGPGRSVGGLIAQVQGFHGIRHLGAIIGSTAAESGAEGGVGAGEGTEITVAAQRRVHLAAP